MKRDVLPAYEVVEAALEVTTDWPEWKDFRILPEEEGMHAEEAPTV